MADQNETKNGRLDRPYAGRRSMQDSTNSDIAESRLMSFPRPT